MQVTWKDVGDLTFVLVDCVKDVLPPIGCILSLQQAVESDQAAITKEKQVIINLQQVDINPRFQVADMTLEVVLKQPTVSIVSSGDVFVTSFPFFGIESSFSIVEVGDVVDQGNIQTAMLTINAINEVPKAITLEPVGDSFVSQSLRNRNEGVR